MQIQAFCHICIALAQNTVHTHSVVSKKEKYDKTDRGFHMLSNKVTSPIKANRRVKTRKPIDSKHITRVGYNIVTNQDRVTGMVVDPQLRTSVGLRAQKDYRHFDIVSNKYVENHDQHFEEDQAASRKIAAEKFHVKRDFDLIKGAHYDKEKEEKFLRTREEKTADDNMTMLNRLPLSYKVSDGMLYNIINGDVYQKEQLGHHEHLLDRRRNIHKRNYKVQSEHRARGDREQDISENRRMARVSYVRYQGERNRGFNIVNQGKIKKSSQPHKFFPKKKLSVWESMKKT